MRPINCDQVSWMLSAIDRYLPAVAAPRCSRAREMQKYGLLYELMEVADLCFADDAAAHNATPRDVMLLRPKVGSAEEVGMNLSGGGEEQGWRELAKMGAMQSRCRLTPAPD